MAEQSTWVEWMHILSFLFLVLATEAEVQESEPARLTPLLYRVQHPLVRFTGGGRLISLMSGEDEEEQPKCVIASVQVSIVYGVNGKSHSRIQMLI